jgi:hypothetical protein
MSPEPDKKLTQNLFPEPDKKLTLLLKVNIVLLAVSIVVSLIKLFI